MLGNGLRICGTSLIQPAFKIKKERAIGNPCYQPAKDFLVWLEKIADTKFQGLKIVYSLVKRMGRLSENVAMHGFSKLREGHIGTFSLFEW